MILTYTGGSATSKMVAVLAGVVVHGGVSKRIYAGSIMTDMLTELVNWRLSCSVIEVAIHALDI